MQQVNLYQKEFYLRFDYRRITAAGSFIFLTLIFVITNTYQTYSTNQLLAELDIKTKTLKTIESTHAILEIKAKPKAIDMGLLTKLERMKRNNIEKRRALNYLSGNDAGNISGFSLLMQGLGRKRDSISGLWLKKIKFSRGGYDLHLSGSSYQPEFLPDFIKALNDEDIYKDREFRKIIITRALDNKNMVDFVLDTHHTERALIGKKTDNKIEDTSIALFMARLKQLSSNRESLQ